MFTSTNPAMRARRASRVCRIPGIFWLLAIVPPLLALPTDAIAAPGVEVLLRGAARTDDQGKTVVELRLLNAGDAPDTIDLPERIEAQIDSADGKQTVVLIREQDTPASLVVTPRGFAEASYRLQDAAAYHDALLSIPAWSTQAVRLTSSPATRLAGRETAGETIAAAHPAPVPTDRTVGNAFVDNLSIYQPIYAVMGTGTNSDARIQFSMKYQLFGKGSGSTNQHGWYFAYTQRMFWDISARSSPFRNIDFQPEVMYISPAVSLKNGITLVGQIGARHESNGRSGGDSRSVNSIYLTPAAAIPLGESYGLTVAPQLSFFVGDKTGNEDIARYRGHGSLFLEVGKDDGLRLSTTTRLNLRSGRGSLNTTLSYPLPRILEGSPDFYLIAQSFVGYGENLLDYNRSTSRLRIGIALTR